MQVLGIELKETKAVIDDEKVCVFSFDFLGKIWQKVIPMTDDSKERYDKVIKQVLERAKITIQKKIIEHLYLQDKDKKSGKYFICFDKRTYKEDAKNIKNMLLASLDFEKKKSLYFEDGKIVDGFYTDNDLALKL